MIKLNTIIEEDIWQSDDRIKRAREKIKGKINRSLAHSKIKFDTQDLEHQILFRMTTMTEKTAFQSIDKIFEEQKTIVLERMSMAKIPPDKLFQFGWQRGKEEWQMIWGKNKDILYCILKDKKGNILKKKEVIFKEITLEEEKRRLKDIIENYHYIHCDRCDIQKGMMFGFYLRGHKIPFAIEEVEPCSLSRNYKKAILMICDINYHTVCELTRFYSVPNCPKNLVGILDKLVGRALRNKGYEFMTTAVMPAFAKTKATTIAGGIDNPIIAKKLQFEFFKRDDGKYELCVQRKKDILKKETIKSKWELYPVIEMIKSLNNTKLENYIYYVEK